MLIIAKIVVHGTLCFAMEMVAEPLGFKEKLSLKHVISVQNRRVERQFHIKREGSEAMGLTQISQGRDLANPLGVEPLSL